MTRRVVGAAAVAVQLEPVDEHPLDVVERVRPVLVAGELDLAPDLLVGRLGLDPVELALESIELAGEARTAQEIEPAELAQPVPQPDLGITGHLTPALRRDAKAARGSSGARASARSRRCGRSGGSTLRARSRPGSFSRVVWATTRGPANDISAPGSAISDVAEAREAREQAAGGRMGHHRDQRAAGVVQLLDRDDGLRQLHQREDPLLHAGAAGGGDGDQRHAARSQRSRTPARTSRP